MSRIPDRRRELNFPFPPSDHSRLPHVFALTDSDRGRGPLDLVRTLPQGAGLIFRHYAAPNREQTAAHVVRACRDSGIICLIAGDLALARKLKANGVHLPEWQLRKPPRGLAAYRDQGGLVTVAAHSLSAVSRAAQLSVDGIFLSPVFPSISHPGGRSLGLTRFARIARMSPTVVFALGGIDAATSRRVLFAGAFGIAGIGLFT